MAKVKKAKRLDRSSAVANLTLLIQECEGGFKVSAVATKKVNIVAISVKENGDFGQVEFPECIQTKTKCDYVEHLHDSLSLHVQTKIVDVERINKFVS